MGRRRKITPTIDESRGRVRARWSNDYGRQQLDLGPADRPDIWRAAHARLLAQLASDPSAGPRQLGDLLVSELLSAWIASDDAAHLKDRTHHRRAAVLFSEQFLDVPADELTPGAVEDWLNALARKKVPVRDGDPGTMRQVYSISTIQKYLGTIKRAWRWAVRRGKLPAERWWEISSVKGPNPGLAKPAAIRQPADAEHIKAIIPHLRPPVRAIVLLEELTGMRPSELFRLRPCDLQRSGKVPVEGVSGLVDLDALGIWVYVPPVRKTKNRWIVFGAKAQKILEPFLDRADDAPLFDPRESLADLRREQRSERANRDGGSGGNRKARVERPRVQPGNSYSAGTFRRAVERACKRAGVPVFTPYQIRHLFAETARDEHGLDHAQAALGHTDPRTSQRYAKRSFKLAVEVAKKSG